MSTPSDVHGDTTAATGVGTGASRGVRTRSRGDRARFWRSPAGQPRWARPALLAIAALAGVLYTARIGENELPVYYSVAVRSMSASWKALLYGAVDPGATVTMDKLAGAFVPQALAVRVLGFHGWVLALPQAIEGVIAVLLMHRIGRRWLGSVGGVLTAALFALTPIAAALFGHPMEDGLLTMALVAAADCTQSALSSGRRSSLMWAALWVGVGFQAKMLQAWLILPAIVVAYLWCGRGPLQRRTADLAAFAGVAVAASLSWLLLLTLTPVQNRPYVDGSSTNNAFAAAFGFNGVGRFGIELPGALPAPPKPDFAEFADDEDVLGPGGYQPKSKLLRPGYASQVGWLYPVAAVGLALGLALGLSRRRRARREDGTAGDPAVAAPVAARGEPLVGDTAAGDALLGGTVFLGLWLATSAAVMSVAFLPHTAYVASLAAPVAALSAAGIVLGWRAVRDGTGLRWLLPVTVAAEAAWTFHIASHYGAFLPWLRWLVAVVAGISAVALLDAGLRSAPVDAARAARRRRTLRVAAAAAVLSLVASPAAWSLSVLHRPYGGTSFDAAAGPVPRVDEPGNLGRTGRAPGPFNPVATVAELPADRRRVAEYLVAHRDGTQYLAAVDGGFSGGPLMTATGQPFLPMGGFNGLAPTPRTQQVQRLVASGRLHYIVVPSYMVDGDAGDANPAAATEPAAAAAATLPGILAWASASCTDVTAEANGQPADDTGDTSAVPLTVLRCD